MVWKLGNCIYCKKTVHKDEDYEWVQKHGMNGRRGEKVYFHRNCYMKTTIGYRNKMEAVK